MRVADPWAFWNERLKAPKYVLGPMVNQSEMQFRILCQKYGTHLCYTPMLHARLFSVDDKYRKKFMPMKLADNLDRPLVAQFAGNDAETLVAACELIEDFVDAIDLNCGCPQGIARRGGYGSYLLSQPDLIVELAEAMVLGTKRVPIFVKIRLLDKDDVTSTIELCQRLEKVGVACIAVHGRIRESKGQTTGPADWNSIKTIVESVKIPIIANGEISCKEDADRCIQFTGAAAAMSAEAVLEDPSLFHTHRLDLDDLMLELCELYNTYPSTDLGPLKAHLWHSLYTGLQRFDDLRERLVKARTVETMTEIVTTLKERRAEEDSSSKIGWYWRHRKDTSRKRPLSLLDVDSSSCETGRCRKQVKEDVGDCSTSESLTENI